MCVFVCLFFQDLSSAVKEVEELTAQLRKQQQQSQQTAQELEQLRKVQTHTHCSSDTSVSEGLSSQATGLVMASLQLQQHLSQRKREQLRPAAKELLFLFH